MKNNEFQIPFRFFIVSMSSALLIEIIFSVSPLTQLLCTYPLIMIRALSIAVVLCLFFYFSFYRKIFRASSKSTEELDKYNIISNIFENSNEAILITDAHAKILETNEAFSRITGYSKEEVYGKTPRIMKSDRHDEDFFRELWQTLIKTGHWQGEIWDRKKSGEIFPKWLNMSSIKNEKGETTYYIGIFSDITALKQTEEQLYYYAYYDILTKLPNRLLLQDRLKQAILQAKRNRKILAVLFIDLDRFKNVNDTLGHRIGDLVLQQVAERLNSEMRQNDTLSRHGGDEFIVIANDLSRSEDATVIAQKILDSLTQNFNIEGHQLFISASIGIALYPLDGSTSDVLLRNADNAMYNAKEKGRNKFLFFSNDMNAHATERLRIETNLRFAIEKGEFILCYQPRINLQNGSIIGMEALIRRQEKDWLVPPSYFIHIAEETGLITEIGIWTLKEACRQTKAWQQEGLNDLCVSVNVSAIQFHEKNFLQQVTDILHETGLNPKYLELEITERSILESVQDTIKRMQALKEMGIHISLDDFGTGYSSLSYLTRLPIDTLKIDISFIKEITTSREGASIVKGIILLAHNLNLITLAEGVETEKEYVYLRENDCDELQGFYFSFPLNTEAFKKFVLQKNKKPQSL